MRDYKHNCGTCCLCMPVNGELICAGYSKYFEYGEKIPDEFLEIKNDCEEYDPIFSEFIDRNELEK